MSSVRKVTAIVRLERLQEIEACLIERNVEGTTVTRVKGYGDCEFKSFFGYASDWLVGHARIEIFVEQERVDELVEMIARAAGTGRSGDGVIAVLPVERFVRIRECCGTSPTAA